MKVVKSIEIQGKDAKLVLLDDNITVQIIYDGKSVSSSAGQTWNNLKDENWAQAGIIKIEVENYLKNQETMKELENIAKEYF